ncbi:MAG: methionine synthase [Planctomycetota bacterium]|nr:methionine synthase [Planctomycetota bacterium]
MAVFESISIPLPYRRIMARLGYNPAHTVFHQHHLALVETAIALGFALCRLQGAYARVKIAQRTAQEITLATSHVLRSVSLSRLLGQSDEALLMAATVGSRVIEERDSGIAAADGLRAAVLDAVASETADAGLTWLHEMASRQAPREGRRITARRFSPGYGDLDLSAQKIVFDILDLSRFGLTLTASYALLPEKSVIGIAGVEPLAQEER